jgi:hypothetical protein
MTAQLDVAAIARAIEERGPSLRAAVATSTYPLTPTGGTCTGADSEECLSCGATPREILVVPCHRGCCDLALCLDCAAAQGYELS